MTKIQAIFLSLGFVGCAGLIPGISVEPGRFCLTVEIAGIPGEGQLCYATKDEANKARVILQQKGWVVR